MSARRARSLSITNNVLRRLVRAQSQVHWLTELVVVGALRELALCHYQRFDPVAAFHFCRRDTLAPTPPSFFRQVHEVARRADYLSSKRNRPKVPNRSTECGQLRQYRDRYSVFFPEVSATTPASEGVSRPRAHASRPSGEHSEENFKLADNAICMTSAINIVYCVLSV